MRRQCHNYSFPLCFGNKLAVFMLLVPRVGLIHGDQRNYTNQLEISLVSFRAISWIVF